jgi:hypothetical protein
MLELAVDDIEHQDELVWNMKLYELNKPVLSDRLSPSVFQS